MGSLVDLFCLVFFLIFSSWGFSFVLICIVHRTAHHGVICPISFHLSFMTKGVYCSLPLYNFASGEGTGVEEKITSSFKIRPGGSLCKIRFEAFCHVALTLFSLVIREQHCVFALLTRENLLTKAILVTTIQFCLRSLF
jgi:hypothetical protein